MLAQIFTSVMVLSLCSLPSLNAQIYSGPRYNVAGPRSAPGAFYGGGSPVIGITPVYSGLATGGPFVGANFRSSTFGGVQQVTPYNGTLSVGAQSARVYNGVYSSGPIRSTTYNGVQSLARPLNQFINRQAILRPGMTGGIIIPQNNLQFSRPTTFNQFNQSRQLIQPGRSQFNQFGRGTGMRGGFRGSRRGGMGIRIR